MNTRQFRHKIFGACLLACAAATLGGCEEWGENHPTRNFDELVNRVMGLVNHGTPEDAAKNLFNVTNPDERRDAIAYLETKPYGHEPPYMRAYKMLTTDPSALVRAQALRALGTSHQPEEAVPLLVKGLSDKEVEVRRDAAWGLAVTFGPEAITPLTDLLKNDSDDQVRLNCARALVNANTAESTRALINALEDKDAGVVYYARQSLWASTHQDYFYDDKAWMTWYDQAYAPKTAPASGPAPG